MKNTKLGFFIVGLFLSAPIISKAQSNSLGDRGPDVIVEESHQKFKPRITRKQKLLFKKPKVQHTAKYEYYENVEQKAREKQKEARSKEKLFPNPKFKSSAEYDFYKRVELAAINRQRIIREMAKPQYSDFAYFGHKHKPKRHLPYAMRYCKECGIRH